MNALSSGPIDMVAQSQWILLWGGVLATACAVAWFTATLVQIAGRPVPDSAPGWDFEGCRRIRLRSGCRLYRWFEPLVDELRACRLMRALGRQDRIAVSLGRGGNPLPWSADEYLALQLLGGLLAGLGAVLPLLALTSTRAAVCGSLGAGVLYVVGAVRRLHRKGLARLSRLKLRLPFAMDLIALTTEAGGTFRRSLTSVVEDCRQEPLGEELAVVLGQLSRGQPFHDALDGLHDRLQDDEIQEIVRTVVSAEEMGTPMSNTFLNLADQMRLRRTQHAEKIIGSAQTMLTFPTIIITVACLITVAAPFLLTAFEEALLGR